MEIPYTYRFPLIHLSGGTEENTQHKGLNERPALPAEFPALLPLPPLAQDLAPGDARAPCRRACRRKELGTRSRGLGSHTEHEDPALAAQQHVARPARGKEPASEQSQPGPEPSVGPLPWARPHRRLWLCRGHPMVVPWSPRGHPVVTPWSHRPCTVVAEAFPDPQLWLYLNTARHSKELTPQVLHLPDPPAPSPAPGSHRHPLTPQQPQQARCALLPPLHLPGC